MLLTKFVLKALDKCFMLKYNVYFKAVTVYLLAIRGLCPSIQSRISFCSLPSSSPPLYTVYSVSTADFQPDLSTLPWSACLLFCPNAHLVSSLLSLLSLLFSLLSGKERSKRKKEGRKEGRCSLSSLFFPLSSLLEKKERVLWQVLGRCLPCALIFVMPANLP